MSDRLRKPLGAFVVVPFALLLGGVLCAVPDSDSLLHVVLPGADVLVPVCVAHRALPVLQPVVEVPVVHIPVPVRQLALALEVVVVEVSFVGLVAVGEEVDAVPREHSIFEVSLVVGAVRPLVSAAADLLPLVEVASVLNAAVVPGLLALAVLLVVDPLAVGGAPLQVDDAPISIRHVIFPVALVHVPVLLCHAAAPTHFAL